MTTPSVEAITQAFPKPTLTRIDGEPNREQLVHLHRQLCKNASKISSNAGGGRYGHLALTLTAGEYAARTGHAFLAPTNPGAFPPHPALGATAEQIALQLRRFKQEQLIYKTYTNVADALKNQLANAVDEVYLKEIDDDLIGFANVSVREMLQHLYDYHGHIDEVDLEANNLKMMKAYDADTPIVLLYAQLENGRDFAQTAGMVISGDMLVTKGVTLLSNTGMYTDAIKE